MTPKTARMMRRGAAAVQPVFALVARDSEVRTPPLSPVPALPGPITKIDRGRTRHLAALPPPPKSLPRAFLQFSLAPRPGAVAEPLLP